ncbi:fasciclin domain-containing protein [Leptolyngbya ohadii]|uniref:fasciclin domain-containing protein n=1 Tax=Leptolyngbya ohadii TaxID=1962290 RepID=UPI001CED6DF6|nr:fasciclin domain-containing protein [Leptolyngbya ohadii]
MTRYTQKWSALAIALLLLPIAAACETNTAQTSTETVPEVAESPVGTSPTETAPTTENRTIADLAATDNSLSTFNTAVAAAGLGETLRQPGPYTVFAPTNEAFAAIPEETRQALLRPENQEQLRQVLSYHIVEGSLPSTQLQTGAVDTVAGQPLNVQIDQAAQQVRVNDASVTQPNLQANNGVVHVVDRVILPPNFTL